MTDKEKLEKIKALADKMYSRMAYLTSDTRPIRKAMEEYHNFIVHEYYDDKEKLSNVERIGKNCKEEPVTECKIIPKPIECYSTCEECPYSTKSYPASEDLEEELSSLIKHKEDDSRGIC